MNITATGKAIYILLNGISVQNNIKLSHYVELQPANTAHLDLNTALSTCSQPDDIAVVAAFIPRISAQFLITAETPKKLAAVAWNSSWDAVLLAAIFHTEIGFNLQSDTSSFDINSKSNLRATNLYMRGLNNKSPYILTSKDMRWIATYYTNAEEMLKNNSFQTAIHCLASYNWHSMPRIKMAVIWAGIEGLFGVDSEIRFKLSIYIARFLYPDNSAAREDIFNSVKKLYNVRSKAVHGVNMKDDINVAVEHSAEILHKLLIQCIETKSLPDINKLVP